MTTIRQRLEYLRGELRAERISYGELAELQSLAEHIDPDDVELREAAGLPETTVERGEKERAMRESMTLRLKLFDLANTFGGDETGDIAIMLHEACNLILRASVKWDDYKSARPLDNDVRIG